MACYRPLPAVQSRVNGEGKTRLRFGAFTPRSSGSRLIGVPCGQCVGCRLERSRQWAVRCMHEAKLHEENSFLTLTYSDVNLPPGNTLVLSHMQDFFKRLRKSIYPKRVRYYHCGEYGDTFGRPHYHALLFGHGFSDRKIFSRKESGNLFTSESLSKLWPAGFSTIGDVTFESAAYVARYVMKKVTGPKAEAHYAGRLPEYTTMSRRPGIGADWYKRYRGDVYPLDRLVINGKDTRPPRYYDRLYEKDSRADFEAMKIKREERNSNKYVDDVLTDGTIVRVNDNGVDRLRVKEVVKLAEVSQLKRPLEGIS